MVRGEKKQREFVTTLLDNFANFKLGALQSKKIPKIRVNYGSRWAGPGFSKNKKNGKSAQNRLLFCSSILCVFCMNLHC